MRVAQCQFWEGVQWRSYRDVLRHSIHGIRLYGVGQVAAAGFSAAYRKLRLPIVKIMPKPRIPSPATALPPPPAFERWISCEMKSLADSVLPAPDSPEMTHTWLARPDRAPDMALKARSARANKCGGWSASASSPTYCLTFSGP